MEDDDSTARMRRSSDDDKLQRLWDQLQDLSEVQDQSRNEQAPVFFSDDSRHFQHEQFINVNQVLNDSVNLGSGIQAHFTNGNHHERFEGENKLNKLNQNKPHSGSVTNYSVFSPYHQEQIKNNGIHQQLKEAKQEKQHQNESLDEINQRLLSDNKKLFDECIKLTKQLLNYEKKQQLKSEAKNQQSKVNNANSSGFAYQKLINQYKETIKFQQLQINDLSRQKARLKEQLSFNEAKYLRQKRQINQASRIRETQIRKQIESGIEIRYKNQIYSLQSLLKLKQDQLQEQKISVKQTFQKLTDTKNQFLKEKQMRLQLQNQINQCHHRLQTVQNQPNFYQGHSSNRTQQTLKTNTENPHFAFQKHSRANSIKSTCISSSSFNEKTHCQSATDKSFYQNTSLQVTLKDKERQITNMKIVHESQLKKYKQIVNQLQHRLLQSKPSAHQ